MKNFLVLLLAITIGLPGLAVADEHSDRVADLEKQITEMTRTLKSMQEQIAALKENDQRDNKAGKGAPGSPPHWTDIITLNGQVRFRGYDLQNMWSYDTNQGWDKWDTFRAKGSLTAIVQATDDVTAVLQLTNQTYGNGVTDKYGQELDNTGNKFFLDNAYVNIRSMFDLPVDLTLGRQNLQYGDGFVIFDGNSQFASTSAYFDGVKISWHPTGNAVLDAFYMKDEENNRDNLSDDDITLSGLYVTVADMPAFGKSDLYLLNRNDESLGKDIWMLGARVSDRLENGFDYTLEAAYQIGDALRDVDQEALGAKLDVGYTFKEAALAPRVFGGFVYLGGDDPDTDKNEGWDVFYGGWGGIYGDLLAWAYVNLPGKANVLNTIYDHGKLSSTYLEAPFSNFQMVTLGAQSYLTKNLSGKVSWGKLTFNETYAGIDDDFGDYYQARLKYQYNKQLSFTLYSALLSPGEAFNHTAMDNATEVYWETNYAF